MALQRRTILAVFGFLGLVLLGLIAHTPDIPATNLENKYRNEHTSFVDIDGLRVHHEVRGQGPTLVLLHGSNASLQTWNGWIEELENRFQIVRLDLPGHGLTGPDEKKRYSWQQMANIVDQFLEKKKIKRYSIAGNSMGGAIAWHLALNNPHKVEKLVLIDSVGYPSEEPMPLIFKLFGQWGTGHLLANVTPRFVVEANIRDAYGAPERVTDTIIDEYHDMTLRAGNRMATHHRFAEPFDHSKVPALNQLKQPTLIMWGGKDKWVLPKYAHWFHRDIPNSTLTIYDDLGHMPMEEAPTQTANDLASFLLNAN